MATIFDLSKTPASVAVEHRSGIPASDFRTLADRLGESQNELASKLRVATRTLTRLAGEHKPLPPKFTEKVLRAARVMIRIRAILSDDLLVVTWLNTEAPALQGVEPIHPLDTDVGA